jgi:hypothetical protein
MLGIRLGSTSDRLSFELFQERGPRSPIFHLKWHPALRIGPIEAFWVKRVKLRVNYIYYRNFWMTAPAFVFSGAMEAFIFVPLMPLILEAIADLDAKKKGKASKRLSIKGHGDGEGIDMHVNDKASSVFQSAQAMGCILGPLIGGILSD